LQILLRGEGSDDTRERDCAIDRTISRQDASEAGEGKQTSGTKRAFQKDGTSEGK